jgi:hypothetical protein
MPLTFCRNEGGLRTVHVTTTQFNLEAIRWIDFGVNLSCLLKFKEYVRYYHDRLTYLQVYLKIEIYQSRDSLYSSHQYFRTI